MIEKSKIYDKAYLINLLCYFGIAFSFISFMQDVGIEYKFRWITKIPDLLVFALLNLSFVGIWLLLKDYIQKFYQKVIPLLVVIARVDIVAILCFGLLEVFNSEVFAYLFIILIFIEKILILVAGIQLHEIKEEQKIGTLFIIYAVLTIVLNLITIYYIFEYGIPLWLHIISYTVDILFLVVLRENFRKMTDLEDELEVKQENFNTDSNNNDDNKIE
ncbi:MAG TPA: hypothetical protein PLH70_00215 [Bacteroidales bacterium]|nr:hypothetical protein [Bacteroidales bacterium]HOH21771.1 hypothetical protein [Bacteroidales bacterium]HPB58004.1 hypothetical protein [Bacteroidales bacterium]HPZ02910.1 hypothetical protein [Bacteroidales bacterium]HQB74208.1 hypothetical protein [Bacteroidales bacterium]